MSSKLREEVETVAAIKLDGAPDRIVADEGIFGYAHPPAAADVDAKLYHLETHGHQVALRPSRDQVAEEISTLLHTHGVIADPDELPAGDSLLALESPEAVAVFGINGPEQASSVLGDYISARTQEPAGWAFRAASKGNPSPTRVPFNPGILAGIGLRHSVLEDASLADALGTPEWIGQIEEYANDPAKFIIATYRPILEVFAPSGAIAAAPPPKTPEDPNYDFQWFRDGGIIVIESNKLLRALEDDVLFARFRDVDDGLKDVIRSALTDFSVFLSPLQGKIPDLGVSRLTLDGTPVEAYGSPQHDGPAYMAFAILGIEQDKPERALELAKPHLDYLVDLPLGSKCYDLWEFAVGDITNAKNLARRALRQAAIMAQDLDPVVAATYRAKELALEEYLNTFEAPDGTLRAGKDYLNPALDQLSQLDMSVISSALVAYDVTDNFMNVDDPRMVKTMEALEAAFKAKKWPVNEAWAREHKYGMALGRRPQDANDSVGSEGGNPWSSTTIDAGLYYMRRHQRSVYLGETPDPEWLEKANGYLDCVLAHVPKDTITEQIHAFTGKPNGARKLGWPHATLTTALLLREKLRRDPSYTGASATVQEHSIEDNKA